MSAEEGQDFSNLSAEKDNARRRSLFRRWLSGIFDRNKGGTDETSLLAGAFVAEHLEEPIHNPSNTTLEAQRARAFMTKIGELMIMESDAVDRSAKALSTTVRELALNARLTRPVTVLTSEGQDERTATATALTALEAIHHLELDQELLLTTPVAKLDKQGRSVISTPLPLPGRNMQLEYQVLAASEGMPAETRLVVAPIPRS